MTIDLRREHHAAQTAPGTIGNWREADLLRWIQGVNKTSPATLPASTKQQVVEVHDTLNVKDKIQLSPQAFKYISNNLQTSFVPIPSGLAAEEVPVWSGTTWVRSSNPNVRINNGGTQLPQVTTSAYSAGPPSSGVVDGDIWIARVADTVSWQFQYHAGSASAYKWECIGGAPYVVQDGTRTTRTVGTLNSWQAVAGIGTITVSRSGYYLVTVGAGMTTVIGGWNLYLSVNSYEPLLHAQLANTQTVPMGSISTEQLIAANTTLTVEIFTDNLSNSIADPFMSVVPIAVQ